MTDQAFNDRENIAIKVRQWKDVELRDGKANARSAMFARGANYISLVVGVGRCIFVISQSSFIIYYNKST